MDEKKAIEMAKEGSERAFNFLYNKQFQTVYGHIYYIVKNKEVAEDLTSETFVKAFTNIHKFERDISFSMWIRMIGNNHTIDYIRKTKKENEIFLEKENLDESDYSDGQNPLLDIVNKEEMAILSNAMSKITGKEKRALELRINQNMSYREIAENLDCSIGAIKSYLHKAQKKVKSYSINQKKEKNNEKKSILLNDNRIVG